ncbi:MAG: apolipoprotein N-acyltransferase [Candidatus Abyssubacteria bacterium]
MTIRNIMAPIATAVVLAAAFPSAALWPLAYVGLVPLLLWTRGKTRRQAFLGGTLAGLVFYGITFSWFASLTYWVGSIVLLGVGLLVVFFSLFWGLIAIGKLLFDRHMPPLVTVAVPSMWVAMEYIHNHIFTGFGWGSLGYTQWNNLAVAQLAALGSVYSVTFYIVLINTLLYEVFQRVGRSHWAWAAGAALVALGITAPLWGALRMDKPDMSSSLRIGVIQPNFSLDVKWGYEYAEHMFEVQRRMTDRLATLGAELVVWPESALYGYAVDEIDRLASIVRSNNVYLLMGSNHYEATGPRMEHEFKYYNSAFLISPEGAILARYDKRHLAPFGEYVPLSNVLGFVGKVVPLISDFAPGTQNTIFEIDDTRFAVLICFENSFPHVVRELAKMDTDFLVQLTNDGWFGRTVQPKQDLAIAVFRAIENGASLVRGTNTGISCFIDPWGRISGVVRSKYGEEVFARGQSIETISTVPHDTFYKAYGDVWALACIFITALLLAACAYKKYRHNKPETRNWKPTSDHGQTD